MTPTGFDHLERELRAGVRRHHKTTKQAWRRSTALALAAALVVSASALAATGTIQIGKPADSGPRPPQPGLRAGPAKTLALRTHDPAGGPPWTLRVFGSTRGAHCVQVGQVVSGHFGVFVPPNTLEPLRAWPGGESSLCSGQSHGGFPVVRGLQRIRVIGGMTDRRRCPTANDPRADCPISSVTLVRYGLLGPDARRVRLIDGQGHTLATANTSSRIGGAYVLAVALPRAQYTAAERAQRAFAEALQREQKAARARGASPDRAFREALSRVPRGHANVDVPPPAVKVLATFANGQTLRVAGPGRTHAALPGLDRPVATPP